MLLTNEIDYILDSNRTLLFPKVPRICAFDAYMTSCNTKTNAPTLLVNVQ